MKLLIKNTVEVIFSMVVTVFILKGKQHEMYEMFIS